MDRQALSNSSEKFSKSLRSQWQMVFLIGLLPYLLSLLHFFMSRPALKTSMLPYLDNLDIISFIIAMGVAVVILNLKRIYFSRRFIRRTCEAHVLRESAHNAETAIEEIFSILRKKMLLVWMLGAVLILEGVFFYWLTYASGNMNVYFMIGAFSLLINYPRKELFEDIPWYVVESLKAAQSQKTG